MEKVRFYVDKEGRTQATMAESERLEDELCDFCSKKNPPFKVYQCKDFSFPGNPGFWSRGEWNACHTCAQLIDANDRLGLAERCTIMLEWHHPISELLKFHEGFFQNKE